MILKSIDLGRPKITWGKIFSFYQSRGRGSVGSLRPPWVHLLFGYLGTFGQNFGFHQESHDSESQDFPVPQTDDNPATGSRSITRVPENRQFAERPICGSLFVPVSLRPRLPPCCVHVQSRGQFAAIQQRFILFPYFFRAVARMIHGLSLSHPMISQGTPDPPNAAFCETL